MAARKTHALGPNQVMALKFLANGPKSTRQIMECLGMQQMQRAGNTMRSLRDRGLVHICEWNGTESGGAEATWKTGNFPDKCLHAKTKSQEAADYKQRVIARIGKGKWSAIQRAQQSKTASVLVIDGVKIWERGKGILV